MILLSRRSSWLALTLTVGACSGGGAAPEADDGEAIEREVFIATYVDLRLEALDNPAYRVDEDERDEILERRGVTEDDLFTFIEVHGTDVEYMRDLWADVEARILAVLSPDGDTVG
jgi:hypothetical protein